MRILHLTVLLTAFVYAISCQYISETDEKLADIASLVHEVPDSAYNMLCQVDPNQIHTTGIRAKYALLYSLAADLSGTGQLNDSIVRIAYNYYTTFGTSSEKAQAQYIRGRMYEENGNENAAMFCYVAAEREMPDSESPMLKGMLYLAKARLYEFAFDYRDAIANYAKANEYHLRAENIKEYVNCCVRQSYCYLELGDNASAESSLEQVKPHWNMLDNADKVRCMRLIFKVKDKLSFEEVREAIKEQFGSKGEMEEANLLSVSDIYLSSGYPYSALKYLNRYAQENPDFRQKPGFYLDLSNIYDSLRLYRQAYSTYKRHVELKDSLFLDRIQENVQFVEEQYEKQEKLYQARTIRVLLVVLLAATVAVAASLIIRYRRKFWSQKRKSAYLENLYHTVSSEKEALSDLISHSIMIDEPTRKILENRLFILNDIVTERLMCGASLTPEKALEILEPIAMDKDSYLNTLGLTFSISHPEMSSYLKRHQMETWEIGYCSLYCMGYKGKDVGNLISTNRYYKINSSIRKKLGVGPKDTNIDIYLRKLMSEIES